MTHKTKVAALKAARKSLGDSAVEGVDFNLRNTGAGWDHESIPAANAAAAKAKATKAPKPKAKAKNTLLTPEAANVEIVAAATEEASADAARYTPAQQRADKAAVPKKARATAKPKASKGKAVVPKAASTGQSKTEMLINMMSRPGGATSKEMEAAAGWVPHSVRGLIGTLKSKGTPIESKKIKGEPTYYSIRKGAAPAPPPVAAPAGDPVGDVV